MGDITWNDGLKFLFMGISHDSVNRFLLREAYEPEDLFNEAKSMLNQIWGEEKGSDRIATGRCHPGDCGAAQRGRHERSTNSELG